MVIKHIIFIAAIALIAVAISNRVNVLKNIVNP